MIEIRQTNVYMEKNNHGKNKNIPLECGDPSED